VWTCDDDKRCITLLADLVLDGIIFDGSQGASGTEDCIRLDETVLDRNLKVNNCVFQYFDDGLGEGHAIKASNTDGMDSLIVTNSLFQHMGHEHISLKDENSDIPPGPCKYLWVENCTFWDSQNEAIYIQSHDDVPDGTPDPQVFINHVTIVSMGSKCLYPNQVDGAVIRNSIVINNSTWENACRIYGTNTKVEGFLYWNCPDGIELEEGATEAQLTLIQAEVDPMMADIENGDFTLDPNSPAVGAGVNGETLGDPRWFPTTAVEETKTAELPQSYQLHQNYPNPFNPKTTIRYDVAEDAHVNISVYNMIGQKVATLVNQKMQAGFHVATWEAASTTTGGIYFYKLTVNGEVHTRKMVLLK
jgi:hypothetical protein